MNDPPPKEQTSEYLQAVEHALGLLDGAERTQAQRRRLSDPAFARDVAAWETRLAGLAEATASVAPPAPLWSRISERLQNEAPADEIGTVRRLKGRVAFWRGAAAAAGLAASVVVALAWPRPPQGRPILTARLSGSPASAVFVAYYDPVRRLVVLTPAQVQALEGRSPELWLIPQGGRPVALGLGNFASSVRLVAARDPKGLAAGVLAVSVEPKGGSPTGQPTGPVIATGRLRQL